MLRPVPCKWLQRLQRLSHLLTRRCISTKLLDEVLQLYVTALIASAHLLITQPLHGALRGMQQVAGAQKHGRPELQGHGESLADGAADGLLTLPQSIRVEKAVAALCQVAALRDEELGLGINLAVGGRMDAHLAKRHVLPLHVSPAASEVLRIPGAKEHGHRHGQVGEVVVALLLAHLLNAKDSTALAHVLHRRAHHAHVEVICMKVLNSFCRLTYKHSVASAATTLALAPAANHDGHAADNAKGSPKDAADAGARPPGGSCRHGPRVRRQQGSGGCGR
mmetsp:Transcript_85862/g.228216  ORF Transcript_85862/g.228216 Transcript_85862/m.228216 type:complete len:279 (-) Transcript_85862:136-972(-)